MPSKSPPPPKPNRLHYLHLLTPLLCYLSYRYGLKPHQTSSDQIIAEILFATPLARTHLRTLTNVTKLNAALRTAILHDHIQFAKSHQNLTTLNDDFFAAQSNPSPPPLSHRELAEYRLVKSAVRTVAKRLLAKLSVENVGKLEVQGWATVHANGSVHEPHTHDGALLAAVYYVAVPQEAGVLRLFNPREGGGVVEVRPGEGEIVVFPAWLLHEVARGEGVRISLAFNVMSEGEEGEFRVQAVGLGRWKEERKEAVKEEL